MYLLMWSVHSLPGTTLSSEWQNCWLSVAETYDGEQQPLVQIILYPAVDLASQQQYLSGTVASLVATSQTYQQYEVPDRFILLVSGSDTDTIGVLVVTFTKSRIESRQKRNTTLATSYSTYEYQLEYQTSLVQLVQQERLLDYQLGTRLVQLDQSNAYQSAWQPATKTLHYKEVDPTIMGTAGNCHTTKRS